MVETREGKIEEAIAQVIMTMGSKRLPPHSSRLTIHLMTNAAVAVYETAVENQRRKE